MPTTRCPDNALDRNFYTVFDWMVDPAGLGLKASSAELSVYAKIYSMSHHSAYGYYVTQDQLALDLYISRRSVQRALDSLCKAGLIGYTELYRTGREANGMKSPRSYFAVQEKINAAIEATIPVSASRGGQILDFDFQQSTGQADAPTCHISAVETRVFNNPQVRLMRHFVTTMRQVVTSMRQVVVSARPAQTSNLMKIPQRHLAAEMQQNRRIATCLLLNATYI